jgi:hypothetical protein
VEVAGTYMVSGKIRRCSISPLLMHRSIGTIIQLRPMKYVDIPQKVWDDMRDG